MLCLFISEQGKKIFQTKNAKVNLQAFKPPTHQERCIFHLEYYPQHPSEKIFWIFYFARSWLFVSGTIKVHIRFSSCNSWEKKPEAVTSKWKLKDIIDQKVFVSTKISLISSSKLKLQSIASNMDSFLKMKELWKIQKQAENFHKKSHKFNFVCLVSGM